MNDRVTDECRSKPGVQAPVRRVAPVRSRLPSR
jgi:hypothetical protein